MYSPTIVLVALLIPTNPSLKLMQSMFHLYREALRFILICFSVSSPQDKHNGTSGTAALADHL